MSTICLVSDSQWKMINGVTSSTATLAKELAQRGHKVILFTAKYTHDKKTDISHGFKSYRFRSFALPKTNRRLRLAIARKKNIATILKEHHVDVLHAMMPSPLGVASLQACKDLGIKSITHSHHQPENVLDAIKVNSKYVARHYYKFLTWFYKKAELVICPSAFSEHRLKEVNANLKTVVISNGIDLNTFSPRKVLASFYKRFEIPSSSKILLSVARFSREKNQQVIIESMRHILNKRNDVFLILIGTGPTKNMLLNKITKLDLVNSIRVLEEPDQNELINAYNACDIFVHPSLVEMEGLSTLEAMACKKPILVADAKESASRFLVDNNGTTFSPLSASDLSKKIIFILQDGDKMNQMGEQSLKIAREKFDIKKSVSMIERLYTSH